MRIGSLFSGYGGLDMAVAAHYGATVAWHVEFDKHPSAILAHHWPDIPNHGDVTAVDWSQVEPVDIITGGFPCQPFSHAGQRRGHHDDRHLWPYMLDTIRVLRPRVVVAENVAGHLTLGFDEVLADLAALGFDAEWGVVSASDAGAPHRRQRLFVVATDATRERHDGAGDAGPRRWAEPTDRGADPDVTLLPTPTARDWKDGATDPDAVPVNGLLGRAVWHIEPIEGDSDAETALAGGPREADAGCSEGFCDGCSQWGPYTAAIARWEQVLGRSAPPPTEPGQNGRPRLSSRFVEFMMGLPDGWVTGADIPRSAQLKALGNGVVPQQAALALALIEGEQVDR